MKPTLKDAALYVRTKIAPKAFLLFLKQIHWVYNFTKERANRLRRYVIITRAYKNGQPVRDIETKFGCSRHTVLRYARMAELPKRPKHFPAEIRQAVLADYRAKVPVRDIAKLHNVSVGYVSKIAREENISRYAPRPHLNVRKAKEPK